MKLLSSVLVLSLLLGMQPAMASKRLGGGGSVGKQSSNVSQPGTPPSQAAASPGASAQSASAATAPAKAPVAAAPAAVAQPKPWGAMLGGLAAGLGLAWLASSLGLGEAFGNLLMAWAVGYGRIGRHGLGHAQSRCEKHFDITQPCLPRCRGWFGRRACGQRLQSRRMWAMTRRHGHGNATPWLSTPAVFLTPLTSPTH
jgi:hypothetical protein